MECLVRVGATVLCFLLIPIALVFVLFGILLRMLAVASGKTDLTFIRPADEAAALAEYVPLLLDTVSLRWW